MRPTQRFCVVKQVGADGQPDDTLAPCEVELFEEGGTRRPFAACKLEVQEAFALDASQPFRLVRSSPRTALGSSSWAALKPGEVLFVEVVSSPQSPQLSMASSTGLHRWADQALMAAVPAGGHQSSSSSIEREAGLLPPASSSSLLPSPLAHPPSATPSPVDYFSIHSSPYHSPASSPPTSRRSSVFNPSCAVLGPTSPYSSAIAPRTPSQSPARSCDSSRSSSLAREAQASFSSLLATELRSKTHTSTSSSPGLEGSWVNVPESSSRSSARQSTARYDSRSASEESLATPGDDQSLSSGLTSHALAEAFAGLCMDRENGDGRTRKARTMGNMRSEYTRTSPSVSRAPSPARPPHPALPLHLVALGNQNRPNSPHPFAHSTPAPASSPGIHVSAPPAHTPLRATVSHAILTSSGRRKEPLGLCGARSASSSPSARAPTSQKAEPHVHWYPIER